jgi:hypothetical protein
MWKRSWLAFTLAAGLLGTRSSRAQSLPVPVLPPGPMQNKATTACTECHETRIVVQQRLSKAAWTKEVDKMIKWGAVVDAQDHDALIEYLSTSFGTDRPAYVPDRLATPKLPKK